MEQTKQTSLGHMPTKEKWEFDAEVTACFEDMLERSIPQYKVMRKAVFDLGSNFVHPQDTVIDLGCSTGEALEPFVRRYGAFCKYIGVEMSGPMAKVATERFAGRTEASDLYGSDTRLKPVDVDIIRMDLTSSFPAAEDVSLVMSVLTMMFIPIEMRQRVIRNVYRAMKPGGAFIMVEKLLGATAEINDMMVDIYHAMKREHGYTVAEVERKRLSLQGVLVPMSVEANTLMLRNAGFLYTDCFWRWFNFGGFIAIKGE